MSTLEERFRAKVDVRGPDDCWLWQGATIAGGYGHLQRGRRGEGTVYAHVLAVTLDGRPPQPGEHVHHRCETPACVNPAHLVVLSANDHAQQHRPTVCKRGHDLATHASRRAGGRVAYCRACRRERRRAAA